MWSRHKTVNVYIFIILLVLCKESELFEAILIIRALPFASLFLFEKRVQAHVSRSGIPEFKISGTLNFQPIVSGTPMTSKTIDA